MDNELFKMFLTAFHFMLEKIDNIEIQVIELENKVEELEIKLLETEQYSEFLGKKISKLNCQKKRNEVK